MRQKSHASLILSGHNQNPSWEERKRGSGATPSGRLQFCILRQQNNVALSALPPLASYPRSGPPLSGSTAQPKEWVRPPVTPELNPAHSSSRLESRHIKKYIYKKYIKKKRKQAYTSSHMYSTLAQNSFPPLPESHGQPSCSPFRSWVQCKYE